MFTIRRPKHKHIVIIRAATARELTEYEKRKLERIEENAQENKIEAIRLNGQPLEIDPDSKTVDIALGDLAFRSEVSPADLADDEVFYLTCGDSEEELILQG
jgi:hypothetical protein